MFLRKLGSTAAAKVLRWKQDRGQRVWWGATATHHWCSRDICCAIVVRNLRWCQGAGRVNLFLRKLGNTAAATVLRRKHSHAVVGSSRNLPLVQQEEKLYHHRRNSPVMTTGAGRVKTPWRRWRFKREQRQLNRYGGRIAASTPAVCSGRGYFKSRGVAVCTPQ